MPPRAKKPVTPPEPEFDPFDEPGQGNVPGGDEAQTEMPPPWEVSDETDVNSTDTNEKKAVVNVSAEGKVVQTYKFGSGYEVPWLVNHSNTVEEALLSGGRTIDEIKDLSTKELFQLLMDDTARWGLYAINKSVKGDSTGGSGSASQGGSQTRSQGRPPAATDGPLGPQHCKHGQKKFWSKFDEEKKELVQIYFCPAPKGSSDKCKNQYVN